MTTYAMTPHEIEVWTLQVVEDSRSSRPCEDSRIELKADWVEPEKAAHQLAAHANAAASARILWIIGIDERSGTLTNPLVTEKSNWLAGVRSFFDGLSPTILHDVNIVIEDKSVVALYFDTEHGLPYVVRHGSGGSYPQYVVPWREGTGKRAARRHELLRLLVPRRSLADLKAELHFNLAATQTGGSSIVFREQAFERAMSDGSIASLDESLRGTILAAYVSIGRANQSLKTASNIPPRQDYWPGFSIEQAQSAVRETVPLIEAAHEVLANLSV